MNLPLIIFTKELVERTNLFLSFYRVLIIFKTREKWFFALYLVCNRENLKTTFIKILLLEILIRFDTVTI